MAIPGSRSVRDALAIAGFLVSTTVSVTKAAATAVVRPLFGAAHTEQSQRAVAIEAELAGFKAGLATPSLSNKNSDRLVSRLDAEDFSGKAPVVVARALNTMFDEGTTGRFDESLRTLLHEYLNDQEDFSQPLEAISDLLSVDPLRSSLTDGFVEAVHRYRTFREDLRAFIATHATKVDVAGACASLIDDSPDSRIIAQQLLLPGRTTSIADTGGLSTP